MSQERINTVRLLRADEIECRVGTANEKGVSLLLFKDARVDQKILDEMFTPFGWKRSHQLIDGNLYCTVEVWDEEKGQWIGKQDVGTMSNAEKEKGQASDSFKRACVNWGIGRELYSAPFIWVPAGKVNLQNKGNRYVVPGDFHVREIRYNKEREICGLAIVDDRGMVVYTLNGEREDRYEDSGAGRNGGIQEDGRERTMAGIRSALGNKDRQMLFKELSRTGVMLETVLGRYGLTDLEQMTPEMYRDAISGLKKTKGRAA